MKADEHPPEHIVRIGLRMACWGAPVLKRHGVAGIAVIVVVVRAKEIRRVACVEVPGVRESARAPVARVHGRRPARDAFSHRGVIEPVSFHVTEDGGESVRPFLVVDAGECVGVGYRDSEP
ncbi:hypothetical protein GSI_12067 [Ganoderma sinense ZZ0214-1]|uniref:Uncharacterized protein n=1 Tax=Ganoderma sinense ZZ0214-1 TaxID=1077348 RepID=A0A2G8RXS0_9APHY|nr:hypothetical protein GSI_12067 [Ganoderma sinense ZZ0214-1]